MDGSFTSIQFEVYEYKYPSIQIDHIFLEVSSMNKICVTREPRATRDFMKSPVVKNLESLAATVGKI